MGWTGLKISRAELVRQLAERYGNHGHHDNGSTTLWTVGTFANLDDPLICCHLIEQHDAEFYYKTISEAEHPYYFDCPVRFFDDAPEKCPEWRAAVRYLAELPSNHIVKENFNASQKRSRRRVQS